MMGTFTYSGDPALSQLDEVRFLIQDTDRDDFELGDEEVNYLLTRHGDASAAAIAACNVLAAKYAGLVDKAVGDLQLSLSQRTEHFRDLAKHLSTTAGGSTTRPKPRIMGRTFTQKDEAVEDTDRIGTAFSRGMDDFEPNQDQNPLQEVWR